MPQKLRQHLDTARTIWRSGVLGRPRELALQLRHRVAMARMQKAFFYQRYAVATLLGRKLGIFEALRSGPLTSQEVAERCVLLPPAAEGLLRVLEGQGFIIRKGTQFHLTEFGEHWLTSKGSQSLASTLDLLAAHATSFDEICEGMRDGSVPPKLDIFSSDGDYVTFLDAVNRYLHWAGVEIILKAQLPEIRSFIVGSMGVSFSARMLEAFPDARVTYGCLEHLVREIPRLRDEYGVPDGQVDGMHSHSGDPTADRWGDERYDLVLLTKKMILEPEQRMGERFAAKAFDVLQPGGVAILWETVHPDDKPCTLSTAMEGVLDLGASPAAPVSTEGGLRSVLLAMGYQSVDFVSCMGGQTTFVVARKAG
ncbi:MAG: hypothetical protein JRI68_03485 [Deltaproteobacteria bacterium]|nr:hypothetical protein [Deltaproteobacteria bacterium]